MNSEVTCDESSLLGNLELHKELNIHVLSILFRDHKNDMDDMHKVVCIRSISVQNQDDNPQEKIPKIISDLFNKKKNIFDTHNMDVMSEDVQGCMDGFVDLHEREDNFIIVFLFDDVLGIKDIGQKKPSIMNEFNSHGFNHQEKVFFHGFQDPMVSLFQSSSKTNFVFLVEHGFNFHSKLPIDDSLPMLFKSNKKPRCWINSLIGYIGNFIFLEIESLVFSC